MKGVLTFPNFLILTASFISKASNQHVSSIISDISCQEYGKPLANVKDPLASTCGLPTHWLGAPPFCYRGFASDGGQCKHRRLNDFAA